MLVESCGLVPTRIWGEARACDEQLGFVSACHIKIEIQEYKKKLPVGYNLGRVRFGLASDEEEGHGKFLKIEFQPLSECLDAHNGRGGE